jgi:hypothetical protein
MAKAKSNKKKPVKKSLPEEPKSEPINFGKALDKIIKAGKKKAN